MKFRWPGLVVCHYWWVHKRRYRWGMLDYYYYCEFHRKEAKK